MDRRSFLKFLLSTPLAAAVDYEQLLWEPKPIITVPGVRLANLSEIVALEIERMVPHIRHMFERDDTFYKAIRGGQVIDVPMGPMKVPLVKHPWKWGDEDF